MDADAYWYQSPSGKSVCIAPSRRDGSTWALYLEDVLVYDGFGSPDEAAFRANKKDLDETGLRLLSGIWVPPELNQWRTTPPEELLVSPNPNN